MSNEHIGRLQKIGFGKETTSGTAVSPTRWIPKVRGQFTPEIEFAEDDSAYGTIDGLKEVRPTRVSTMINLEGIARDVFLGDLLMAAFGTTYKTQKLVLSSVSGTFVVGENVTGGTSSAVGVIRRIDISGTAGVIYVTISSGTFQAEALTGGTSSATATAAAPEAVANVSSHIFSRLNTNNHPAYTFYGQDAIGDERAAYCMLDTIEFEARVGDYLRFSAQYRGKKLESTSAQTVTFTEQKPFLAAHGVVSHAASFSDIIATPSTINLERIRIAINKNVVMYQALGDDDVASLHNTVFEVEGDMDLLYNAATWRDYAIAGTDRALRVALVHDDTITGASAQKYTLQFDLPEVNINEWSRTDDNNALVRQTVGFRGVFNVSRSLTAEALLINGHTTAY